MIYFDHAASTPIDKEVLDQMMLAFKNDFANSSAKHSLGRQLGVKLEDLRESFKKTFKADDSWELLFTSSATESNNLVFHQMTESSGSSLFYLGDHMSVVKSLKDTQHRNFNPQIEFDKQWPENEQVKLLVLSPVNNHSGVKIEYKQICSHAKEISPRTHIPVSYTHLTLPTTPYV